MVDISVRYLREKRLMNGERAYYWNCARAKKLGLQASVALGSDLKKAIERAEGLNSLLDAVRSPEAKQAPIAGTLGWMMDRIEGSKWFAGMREKTRLEILGAFKVLRGTPYAQAPMSEISGEDLQNFQITLVERTTLDVASRTLKWLRWIFNKALMANVLTTRNPMDKVKINKPKARQVFWEEDEVARAVAKAKEWGWLAIAAAIQLAFDLGQREKDVLAMQWSQIAGDDVVVKQSKGSTDERPVVVRIPMVPELKAILKLLDKSSPVIVTNPNTERPYQPTNFNQRIAELLRAVDLKGLRYSDLRRSAVVRLAQAGCTIPEIAAITGHSYTRCEQILEVYLPRTTPVARAAIEKLLAARKRKKKEWPSSRRT